MEVTAPSEAVIAEVPSTWPVARPAGVTETAATLPERQTTLVVMSGVLPSVYVPSAVYCCVRPAALLTAAGVIWIDTSSALVTVNVAVFDLMAPSEAVMFDAPSALAVAKPAPLMLTLATSLEDQSTARVMSRLGPLEYVPMAL